MALSSDTGSGASEPVVVGSALLMDCPLVCLGRTTEDLLIFESVLLHLYQSTTKRKTSGPPLKTDETVLYTPSAETSSISS
jgi:hypothetical protein